jgi:Rrf2 family protein
MITAQKKRPDPVTSEQIASSVNTNPVVVRRMLGLLQQGGLVRSLRGAHAGWLLAKAPETITLLDVYHAVENEPLFGLHVSTPNQACPIGSGIQPALRKAYGEIELKLRQHLSEITVEQVLADTLKHSKS